MVYHKLEEMEDKWCRTCLQKVSSEYYDLEHTEPDEVVSIGTKLQSVAPSLDVNVVIDAVICSACLQVINAAYTFQSQCYTVDKHIRVYCSRAKTKTLIFKDLINFIESPPVTTEVMLIKDEDVDMSNTTSAKSKKLYDCTHCDRSFRWLRNLKRHSLTHNQSKPFTCDQCEFRSNRKDALHNHVSNKHVDADKPYKCEHCALSFAQRYTLARHMQTHAEDKPYKCADCDFSCKFESYLKRHLSTHVVGKAPRSDLKPFRCDICEYCSYDRKGLRRHVMIHTGEKPYTCADCEYKTTEKSKLVRHRKTHAREFRCAVCEYKTRFKAQLTRHASALH
ncbi:hypothetical protein PPYR_14972 [Photinus pyralis]|uniref:C2H2-type domain-containing protein n=2 Tax=Photinus pyralis TaxID=7054 RepID=A0A1Y1KXV9_PHOPY|nr:zinc finger protein Xfin-like [Photinus pyralis]KAB0790885.1 hypothetical protein PPYR_14972 [Photinus pyralis]